MIENQWRDEHCPDYGHVYCDCPFFVATCDGAWSCEDIENISIEVIAYYDTNSDNAINPEDTMDEGHYNDLVAYCDFNNDGTIDACEVHDCLVIVENEWRMENCPDYGAAYCNCPFTVAVCEGAWNCADIITITEEVMVAYDTNGDGNLNLGDNIEEEHLQMIVDYCD
jgi:predicted nucleic acid-binding Zn finger protein